jgi:predicted nucleic acid-binding protein
MPGRFVLDSYALIGYLENEPFAGRIQKYLKQARKAETSLYLHSIHLGEVYYITLREQGQNAADLAYARIKAFPLTFIDKIDEELLLKAASLKAGYPISYVDSFAAALAKIHNCALLTGDPELKVLEKESIISIDWLTA